jgi:MFS family permease
MVGVSIVIRMRMKESPLFEKVKAEGKTSKNPLKESFGNKLNFKFVLLALFGATMGQGVVWYTGQFYALSFIQNTLSIEISQASKLIMYGLGFATPFFLVFGALSDKIGRKWIMLAGMLLAIICYRPIYSAMYKAGSAEHKTIEATSTPETSIVPGESLSKTIITSNFTDGSVLHTISTQKMAHSEPTTEKPKVQKIMLLDDGSFWKMVWLVFIQVIFVTMVYGPIAAFLVEMFPVKIRYTSMSLPYHIGNGIFGGLLPAIATFLATKATFANQEALKNGTAIPYSEPYLEGLWYPIIVAGICFVIGALYINEETNKTDR